MSTSEFDSCSSHQNGDSIDTVAAHFSSYRLLDDSDSYDMKNVTDIWTSNRWMIEKDDQLYYFGTLGGGGTYLQFRDDRLINLSNQSPPRRGWNR